MQIPRVEVPYGSTNPSLSREKLQICETSPILMGFLVRTHLCLFYPYQCVLFIVCCEGAVRLVFRYFFRENCSMCNCRFCTCGGSGLKIILCPMWITPLISFKDEEIEEKSHWIVCQCHTTTSWLGWDLNLDHVSLRLIFWTLIWYDVVTSCLISVHKIYVKNFLLQVFLILL